MSVTYEIDRIGNSLYVLVSKVPIKTTILPGGVKWGGGVATNYVAEGTKEYCESIKERLESQ